MKRSKLLCYGHFCYPQRIKHERHNLIKYHGKNYCKRCLRYKKEASYFKRRLYYFIETMSHVTFPTGMMLRNIKELRVNRHYTYRGILLALKYIKKIRKNFNWDCDYFINYVPYVYERAKKWRYKQAEHGNLVHNAVKDKSLGHLDDNTVIKTVTYTRVFHRPPKSKPTNMKYLDKELNYER